MTILHLLLSYTSITDLSPRKNTVSQTREMSRRDTDKVPFTSHDPASYFSEEEWKLLHEWQKELYKNVMTEIHQALISLGPLIATTVFSLRAKEKEVLCHVDQEDSDVIQNMYHSPRFVSLSSDDDLSMEQVPEGRPMAHPGSAGGESHSNPRSGHDTHMKIITLNVKEEEEDYPIFHQDYERRESIHCTTGSPFLSAQSVLTIMDDIGAEGEVESRTSVGQGDRSMKRKSKKEETEKNTEKIPTFKISLRNSKVNVLHSSEKRTNSVSHLRAESNQTLQAEQDPQESDFNNELHSNAHLGAHNTDSVFMYDDCESILRNATFVACPQKTSYDWRQYIGTEFEDHSSQNGLIHHQRSDYRKRPFHCTKCKKSFIQKRHLNRHLSIHTGERPYHCTECGKSFIQKQHFIGHQRVHTGERPYKCNQCDKSYTLKQCLIIHQRKHTQQKTFQYTEREKRFSQKQNLIH
ncbi:zinc finger protein 765-like isoform X2 [Ambystoma mexicanum]|uniref:zinc finger protein 765-like isoform X2 n=1 Tax=Ambystoma mexicanum TaxID=8296 RepID=UPI0037E98ADE